MGSVSGLGVKLVHPLAEIRARALASLQSKIHSGLVSCKHIAQDGDLLVNLLTLLGQDTPIAETIKALELLQYILHDFDAKSTLSTLGLEDLLHDIIKSCHYEAAGLAKRVKTLLLSCHPHTVDEPGPNKYNQDSFTLENVDSEPIKCLPVSKENAVVKSEREIRLDARTEWRKGTGTAAYQEDVPSKGGPLQYIRLNAADDQHLFELSVRLRYGEDPRVVLPALYQLAHCCVVDFPPQVFLQQDSLMDGVLAILKSGSNLASPVVHLTLEFLYKLTRNLLRSLDDALDPDLHTHCTENEPSDFDTYTQYLRESLPKALRTPEQTETKVPGVGCCFSLELEDRGVDIARCINLIGSHVFPLLRDEGSHLDAIPLAENLISILLHEACLKFYPVGVHPHISQHLESLSEATHSFLSHATNSYRLKEQDDTRTEPNQPHAPILDRGATLLIQLAIRSVMELTKKNKDPECTLIPASLLRVLSELSLDAVTCCILPDLKACVEPYLQSYAPHVEAIQNQVDTIESAIGDVNFIVNETKGLMEGLLSFDLWLDRAQKGMGAIDWVDADSFLRSLLCGAVLCVIKHKGDSTPVLDGMLALIRDVLTMHGPRTAQQACVILQNMLSNNGSPAVKAGAVRLMTYPTFLKHFMVTILTKNDLKQCGGQLLNALVRTKTTTSIESEYPEAYSAAEKLEMTGQMPYRILTARQLCRQAQKSLAHWDWLLHCYESDCHLGSMATAFNAQYNYWLSAGDASDWLAMQHTVRGLFHVEPGKRQSAASALWDILLQMEMTHENTTFAGDPFGDILKSPMQYPQMLDSAAALSSSFSKKDVDNLVNIVLNDSLDIALRRAAIEHLGSLAQVGTLHNTKMHTGLIDKLFEGVKEGLQRGGDNLPLVLACLSTLTEILCNSKGTMEECIKQADRLLFPLLALSFHDLLSIKRLVSKLLAFATFPPLLERNRASNSEDRELMVQVTEQFNLRVFVPDELLAVKGKDTDNLEVHRNTENEVEIKRLLQQRQLLSQYDTPDKLLGAARDNQTGINLAVDSITMSTILNIYVACDPSTIENALSIGDDEVLHRCLRDYRALELAYKFGISRQQMENGCCQALLKAVPEALPKAIEGPGDCMKCMHVYEWIQGIAVNPDFKDALPALFIHMKDWAIPYLGTETAGQPCPSLPVVGSPHIAPSSYSFDHNFGLLRLTGMTLDTLIVLVKTAKHSLAGPELWSVISSLDLEELTDILLAGYIVREGCDYGCRLKAIHLLGEIADAVAQVNSSCHLKEDVLGGDTVVMHCIAPLVRSLFMTEARCKAAGQFKHQDAIRKGLVLLNKLLAGIDSNAWVQYWKEVSGVTWISKLSRDQEARIRSAALEVLVSVARDRTGAALEVVFKGWPECLQRVVDIAGNEIECNAVRVSAMRVLCQVLAYQTETDSKLEDVEESDHIHSFLLSISDQGEFWQKIVHSLIDPKSTVQLSSAATSLLLQACISPLSEFANCLANPQVIQHLKKQSQVTLNQDPIGCFSITTAHHGNQIDILDSAGVCVACKSLLLLKCLIEKGVVGDKEVGQILVNGLVSLERILGLNVMLGQSQSSSVGLFRQEAAQSGGKYAIQAVLGITQAVHRVADFSGIVKALQTATDRTEHFGLARHMIQVANSDQICVLDEDNFFSLVAALLATDELTQIFLGNDDHHLGCDFFHALESRLTLQPKGECSGSQSVIAAARNLLDFSGSAKEAAVSAGFHRKLIKEIKSAALASQDSVTSTGVRSKKHKEKPHQDLHKKKDRKTDSASRQSTRTSEVHLTVQLSLLRHLAFKSGFVKDQCIASGIIEMLAQIWETLGQFPMCKHEAMTLAANLCSGSVHATMEMAVKDSETSLLSHIVQDAKKTGGEVSRRTAIAALQCIKVYTATKQGVQHIVKSGLVEASHTLLERAIATKDTELHAATLQVLVNVAAYPEGQKCVLQQHVITPLLELVLQTISHNEDGEAKTSAVFLVRNLCFATNFAHYLLAQSQSLSLLLHMATCMDNSASMQRAIYASSGLWALIAEGEKVKAAFRSLPGWQHQLDSALDSHKINENNDASCKLENGGGKVEDVLLQNLSAMMTLMTCGMDQENLVPC